MYKYMAGFLGAGNMGGALAKAVCEKINGKNVVISCLTLDLAREVANRLLCNYDESKNVALDSKYVFLGVKPQNIKELAAELKNSFEDNKESIIVSMVAGVNTDTLKELFGDRRIIRIMPNTPAMIKEGMILTAPNKNVTPDDIEEFKEMMSLCGRIDVIDEGLIDAGTAVSGCGPAFCYMFMDAMAKAGEKCGLTYKQALEYSAQTLIGSANMVLKTGKTAEELKIAVCSPGGSTIEGVKSLERDNLYKTVENAVDASYKKTKQLG